MKNHVLSIILIGIVATAYGQQQFALIAAPATIIPTTTALFNWSETTVDLGQLKLNTPVTHEFKFINTGSVPLVISSVKASCGCTITSYTKSPVAEGSTGFVSATYNAATLGVFTKTISVNANTTGGVTQLVIKGEVVQ